MKMKKWISLLTVLVLVLALTACGGGSEPEETGGEEDGQNPVMNFVGNYQCDRAGIFISAEGMEDASATVTWGSSVNENSTWTMSGKFDSDKLSFDYENCVRTDYIYSDDGEVQDQTEVYTDGTGTIQFAEGEDGLELTWTDNKENMAEGMVFIYTGAAPQDEEEMVGMANPWSDVDSAEAAAEGAGLEFFEVPDGDEISLGKVEVEQYRCMEGIAEARIPIGAVDMTIRKGLSSAAAEPGDISGDYGEYEHSWTQSIKGLEVTCFGNREGEATKTIWNVDDYSYSITAFGEGGDDDFGLNADDLSSLINGIQ